MQNQQAFVSRDAKGFWLTIENERTEIEILDQDRDQYIVLTNDGVLVKIWKHTHFFRILKKFDLPK